MHRLRDKLRPRRVRKTQNISVKETFLPCPVLASWEDTGRQLFFFFFYFCCSFSLLFIRTAQHTPNSSFNNLLMLGEEKKNSFRNKSQKAFRYWSGIQSSNIINNKKKSMCLNMNSPKMLVVCQNKLSDIFVFYTGIDLLKILSGMFVSTIYQIMFCGVLFWVLSSCIGNFLIQGRVAVPFCLLCTSS